MAYNTDTAAVPASNAAKFEPALGFLNLALPNETGALVKVGAIPLKASNAAEADMDASLNDASISDDVLAWVKDNLVITYGKNVAGSKKPLFAFKKAA